MTKNITHGWTTAESDDPDYDVSADEINQHQEVYSGLTAGHYLRASGATAADFAAIQDGDLPASIARDSEVTSAVSAAVAGLSTVYQPLDSDLTAIAALSTTSFGRGLLALADQAALLAAAGAAASGHNHSGTYQPVDGDLTAIAALSTTAYGRALLELADQAALQTAVGSGGPHSHAGEDITSGTVADARVAATMARDSEVTSAVSTHEAASDPHPGYLTGTEGDAAYQPKDSDLTAIAALTTTSFGRGLLELANAAALLSAAGGAAASHAHSGADITSGTVVDARVDAALARDSEVTAAVAAEAALARNGDNITSGTVADARIASTIARDSEVTSAIGTHEAAGDPHPGYLTSAEGDAAYQPLDSDLTAVAALSPSNDDVVQRKAGAWTNRTMAQVIADLAALGTTFQPLDSDLTSIAALTTTSYGRALLALADAAALRTSGGLVIGTDIEAHDADLTTIAGLSPSNDDIVQRKSGAWANRTIAQLLTDLAAAGTTFQPLDSDLTSIAALTTTSFGRGLLALADAAALAANHSHGGGALTVVPAYVWAAGASSGFLTPVVICQGSGTLNAKVHMSVSGAVFVNLMKNGARQEQQTASATGTKTFTGISVVSGDQVYIGMSSGGTAFPDVHADNAAALSLSAGMVILGGPVAGMAIA